ncbi:glucosaminidase domain-containing protein [Litorilituus sediminis]|uniref:Glucosaminidase n=1 Tax=Litorilituus sediminis TaxID=718192 RepID=A0A4P6P0U2_9GAMM|nr:glucosaminidase domain-containing protein [Litorilituus sediminis]QBG34464.1 glucosaminidase [Litorilituus sediminis]
MKIRGLIKVLLVGFLLVGLAAPFTFMPPPEYKAPLKTTTSDLAKSEQKAVAVKKPKTIKEKPLHDVKLPDFASIRDIATKKKRFFDFIQPAVAKQNQRLLQTRQKLEYWLEQITLEIGLTETEQAELAKLAKRYRVNKHSSTLQKIDELLERVDIIPESLVLVQAANESAWGTSRFARIGLNFFGIWCYQPKCGMVPNGRNEGAKHEVAAFDSVDDAVKGYFRNINTHNAYMVFRSIRSQLRAHNQPLDAEILATGLLPYSERGAHYVLDITDMLRHNQRFFAYEDTSTHLSD